MSKHRRCASAAASSLEHVATDALAGQTNAPELSLTWLQVPAGGEGSSSSWFLLAGSEPRRTGCSTPRGTQQR